MQRQLSRFVREPESVRFAAGAIVTAAITSTFVERAQARRGIDEATHHDLAAQRLDARLQDLTERLARVEQMLIDQSRGAGSR